MKSILSKLKLDLKRIKDPVIRERLLMIQDAFKYNLRDAAATFGCTHGKVAYWKNRYKNQGIRGLYTKEKSGRPSKMKPEIALKIKRKIRRHNIKKGWTTKTVRDEIHKEAGIKYCKRQVIRISQKWGLAQITPRKRSAYSKKEDREEFLKKTKNS
jgi:transposase